MTDTPRRVAIFGPETWATFAGAQWCHFDRWFALVAVTAFAGDLDALEQELVGGCARRCTAVVTWRPS